MEKTYLVHHGIDGQKWGVQNGPPYPLDKSKYSRAEKKELKRAVKEKKKERRNANKYKVLMNDKELEARKNRLSSEAKLNELTKESLSPGKKAVSDIFKKAGGKAATAVATGALIYVGMKAADKVIPGAGEFVKKTAFKK